MLEPEVEARPWDEQLDREHQPLGVAGPDRDVTAADAVEGR